MQAESLARFAPRQVAFDASRGMWGGWLRGPGVQERGTENGNISMSGWRRSLAIYTDRRVLLILPLGFASGLPLLLTASTLSAWLATAGIRRAAIGAFALVGFAMGVVVVVTWISHGFGSLADERLALVSASLVIVGIQIFFSSFLLSILGLRRR